jgi:predicted O-linked N-acetylglucosamine transferase (SPINDLY family)
MQSYDKAIQLKPDFVEAYSNRGAVLRELRQLQEAVASCDKAIQLKPDYVEAYNHRGNALGDLGRLDEAMQNYDKAIQLKPDYVKAYGNLLMTLNYTPNHNAIDHIAIARKFGEIVTEKTQIHFSAYKCLPMPERLRVGFVSGDLRNHPVGYFLESVLSSIDSSKIELIAYPTTPKVDDLSDRIKPFFSMWKPIYGQTDEAAANMIYADGVHVLIDLSGHTADNRLPMFGCKPSPVQVSWLGYFATTGLNEMDYLLGDPYVTPPEDDDQFTEKVWRLPETRWCFTPPDVDVEVSAPPALKQDYVTFGCFSNLTKINDKVVELWAKVLDAIPNSRLLLKAKQLRDQLVRESIIQRFAAQGINSKRISLEESEDRQKYFAAYNRIDITLDPFPFTGGTTSVESLWMGVPLITLAGDSLISRQGVGVLTNAGLPDWIADDEESYLAKAIIFASDLDKLARLRANLRSQVLASPLFDAPRFAQNFENALFEMWNQYAHQSRKKYP